MHSLLGNAVCMVQMWNGKMYGHEMVRFVVIMWNGKMYKMWNNKVHGYNAEWKDVWFKHGMVRHTVIIWTEKMFAYDVKWRVTCIPMGWNSKI